MIAVSYIMKRKIKKIFFEVISNSKIFNINFFQQNSQRPRFSQTYRGTRQRGDWTMSNTVFICFSEREDIQLLITSFWLVNSSN